METSKDLFTGEQFEKRRINQQFANSKNRMKYHNGLATALRHKLSYIDKPLKKNYSIICKLLDREKEGEWHKEYLKGCGFTFSVFTHYSKMADKSVPSIYEFAIIQTENNKIRIVRNGN